MKAEAIAEILDCFLDEFTQTIGSLLNDDEKSIEIYLLEEKYARMITNELEEVC